MLRLMASKEASSPWFPWIICWASGSWVPGCHWYIQTVGQSSLSRVVRSIEETGPFVGKDIRNLVNWTRTLAREYKEHNTEE